MLYTNNLPFPVASIEFDKVYRVMDKRLALGYSDRELSFLLGYRPLYVRDVEDPTHTLRYTPKDTNYLLCIFDCKLSEIMSPKIQDLFYQVKVTVTMNNGGSRIYEISRELKNKQYGHYRTLMPGAIRTSPGQSSTSTGQINEYIDHLFKVGYFEMPKTALEVFKICIKKFDEPIQPQYVLDAISFYTGKRKSPRLIQMKNESARTAYLMEV